MPAFRLLPVLAAELLNSGLEALVDKLWPERHELAGRAKDMGSAAGMVWRGIHAPTAGETLRTTELKTETDAAQTRLDRLIGTRIDAINKLFGTTPRILTPKTKVIS